MQHANQNGKYRFGEGGILMKFRKVAATALALCMAAGFAGYVPAIPDIGITACAEDVGEEIMDDAYYYIKYDDHAEIVGTTSWVALYLLLPDEV